MKIQRLAFLLLPLWSLACGPSATVRTPEGFAQLDGGDDYAYRATSAQGVVIAVRTVDNDPHGNLAFWSDLLDRDLRQRGYAKDGERREVKTREGLVGRQLRYAIDKDGRPHRFWLSVFVTPSVVVTVEAGGDEAFFDADAERLVDDAVSTLDVG